MPIFLVIMLSVSAIAPDVDNPEETSSGPEIVTQFRGANELLFRRAANHDGRNIFQINETVEEFCAGKVGKKYEIIINLFDFAADLFSRVQA